MFYLITLDAAEQHDPWLKRCGLPVYAAEAYTHFALHPHRTLHPMQAAIWVFPPYMAWETNWPKYGAGFTGPNVARPGKSCVFDDALMDTVPLYLRRPLLDRYDDSQLVWAKLNALRGIHRPGIDISLPPPPGIVPEQFVPHQPSIVGAADPATGRERQGQGQGAKWGQQQGAGSRRPPKWLLTFRGNFQSRPDVRGALGLLTNLSAGVIAIDSSQPLPPALQNASDAGNAFGYTELMANSAFTAVVAGDVEFSYRFTEAVRSGAVPVLISDGWVPPFNDTIPFDTYGLHILYADLGESLIERLRSMPSEVRASMRRKAAFVCHRNLGSVFLQIETLIDVVLSRAEVLPPVTFSSEPNMAGNLPAPLDGPKTVQQRNPPVLTSSDIPAAPGYWNLDVHHHSFADLTEKDAQREREYTTHLGGLLPWWMPIPFVQRDSCFDKAAKIEEPGTSSYFQPRKGRVSELPGNSPRAYYRWDASRLENMKNRGTVVPYRACSWGDSNFCIQPCTADDVLQAVLSGRLYIHEDCPGEEMEAIVSAKELMLLALHLYPDFKG
eukprot:gene6830-30803_t